MLCVCCGPCVMSFLLAPSPPLPTCLSLTPLKSFFFFLPPLSFQPPSPVPPGALRDNCEVGDQRGASPGHQRSPCCLPCLTLPLARPGGPRLHPVEEEEEAEEGGTMGPGRALHARGMKTLLPWTARVSRRP